LQNFGTPDHYVPTISRDPADAATPEIRRMVEAYPASMKQHGIPHVLLGDERQGIVHIIGPELGITQPGLILVCGDSHTSTHGALGALAFGIGQSENEHVLATQTLWQAPVRTLRIRIEGARPAGVTAKDVILAIIAKIGAGGAVGHVIEYAGSAVRAMSIEERLTLCNMSIEAGARAGMVAPDETTFVYVEGRPHAPHGADWERALAAPAQPLLVERELVVAQEFHEFLGIEFLPDQFRSHLMLDAIGNVRALVHRRQSAHPLGNFQESIQLKRGPK
jgi:3-isopropylmalate/(R)-2-methylmalate dehydratase large subunit